MRKSKQTKDDLNVMHRIKQVRENEGITLRAMSIRMKTPASELKRQERADYDLRLSDLHRWQAALDVPLNELIDDPSYRLSEKLRHRANLLRVAKTARSILGSSTNPAVRRLAATMVEQLVEVMPELKDQGAWPEHANYRTRGESRLAERLVDTRYFPVESDYEMS